MTAKQMRTDPDLARFTAMIEGKIDGLRDLNRRTAVLLRRMHGESDAERRAAVLVELDQLQGGAEAIWQGMLFEIETVASEALRAPGDAVEAGRGPLMDRTWDRCRAELDRATNADALLAALTRVAEQMVATGDPDMVHLLHDRLPEYCAARGWTGAAAEAVARVDEIQARTLPPLPRAALLARAGLSRGWPRVLSGFNLARAELHGGETVHRLPGFAPDEWIPVGDGQ